MVAAGACTAGRTSNEIVSPGGFRLRNSSVPHHSRLAYSEILPDEKGATSAGLLARAIDSFAHHEIARIERPMTDNARACRY